MRFSCVSLKLELLKHLFTKRHDIRTNVKIRELHQRFTKRAASPPYFTRRLSRIWKNLIAYFTWSNRSFQSQHMGSQQILTCPTPINVTIKITWWTKTLRTVANYTITIKLFCRPLLLHHYCLWTAMQLNTARPILLDRTKRQFIKLNYRQCIWFTRHVLLIIAGTLYIHLQDRQTTILYSSGFRRSSRTLKTLPTALVSTTFSSFHIVTTAPILASNPL
jgi:hypothetical protein